MRGDEARGGAFGRIRLAPDHMPGMNPARHVPCVAETIHQPGQVSGLREPSPRRAEKRSRTRSRVVCFTCVPNVVAGALAASDVARQARPMVEHSMMVCFTFEA